MSVDFIKERRNAHYLNVAQRQQKQLSYFTQSSVQENLPEEYYKQWANRKYAGSDYFQTWVKQVFREDNFLSFCKYMRFPLPSAKIVNDDIKPQLQRVFHAEDSYFKYLLGGKEIPCPEFLHHKHFDERLFNSILFSHNDIVISDLEDTNKPYREIVSIDKVVAIEAYCSRITQIAYTAEVVIGEASYMGYAYIDETQYIFYDQKYNILLQSFHDLGQCPADYVSSEPFSSDNDIVRKSIFSYVRPELEEYVFLKTLQKMSEPNGAFPVAVYPKFKTKTKQGHDINGASDKQPMSAQEIGGQKASIGSDVNGSDSLAQPGSTIKIPAEALYDKDQKLQMDLVEKFIKFHYIPKECLDYINERVKEIPANIINSVLGDYVEQNQSAKNELQVGKSYDNKKDKLRWLSTELSRIRNLSDFKTMALKWGKDRVMADCFYGSDWFLESQAELFEDFKNAPNPIIRKEILIRIARNSNKNNPKKGEREVLLYMLMPYVYDKDFETALNIIRPPDEVIKLYLQFNYWISLFESKYGDVLVFTENLNASESEKVMYVTNLLYDIIKSNELKQEVQK